MTKNLIFLKELLPVQMSGRCRSPSLAGGALDGQSNAGHEHPRQNSSR
jgi:hypothetical protein